MYEATIARTSTEAIMNVVQNSQADDIVSAEVVSEDSIDGTRHSVYAVEVTTQATLDGEGVMPQ